MYCTNVNLIFSYLSLYFDLSVYPYCPKMEAKLASHPGILHLPLPPESVSTFMSPGSLLESPHNICSLWVYDEHYYYVWCACVWVRLDCPGVDGGHRTTPGNWFSPFSVCSENLTQAIRLTQQTSPFTSWSTADPLFVFMSLFLCS